MPASDAAWTLSQDEEEHWAAVLRVRSDVNKALELARAEKRIGKPLDASVTLFVSGKTPEAVRALDPKELAPVCIVSELRFAEGEGGFPGENVEGMSVRVEPSELPRCERCWTHDATVGQSADHPTLCARCAAAIGG